MQAMTRRALTALAVLSAILPLRPALAALPVCGGKPPVIGVTADIGQPVLDFSKNRAALNGLFSAIPLPDSGIYHMSVNSVMTGSLAARHTANIHVRIDPSSGFACLDFDRLEVTLELRPVIYIASEYRRSECRYKALLDHEMKHVEADRAILDRRARMMKDGLTFAFAGAGDARLGPFPAGDEAKARAALESRIQGAIEVLLGSLVRDRVESQRAIDTMHEYLRVDGAC